MTAITVSNPDWTIVSGVQTALIGATISGVAVFTDARISTTRLRTNECQFKDSPIAIVQYISTSEDQSPEDTRSGVVSLEILAATKVETTAGTVDEAERLQEALRLKNAVVNAVEADPPDNCHAVGDGNFFHNAIAWGVAQFDTDSRQPWVIVRIPCEMAFSLDSPTAH